jgi:hypothetical protein
MLLVEVKQAKLKMRTQRYGKSRKGLPQRTERGAEVTESFGI